MRHNYVNIMGDLNEVSLSDFIIIGLFVRTFRRYSWIWTDDW